MRVATTAACLIGFFSFLNLRRLSLERRVGDGLDVAVQHVPIRGEGSRGESADGSMAPTAGAVRAGDA